MDLKPAIHGKRWIAQPGSEDDTWLLVQLKRNGSRPAFGPLVAIKGKVPVGNGEIGLCINSRHTYILRETFPRVKTEILRLQIDQRLRQIGLWPEGTNLHHCIKRFKSKENREPCTILSIPEEDVNPVLAKVIDTRELKLNRTVPMAAAVAGLLGALSSDPVLAAYFDENALYCIVVHEKIPVYLQIVPLDTDGRLEEPMLAQTFEMVFRNVRRLYGIEVAYTTVMGPGADTCPAAVGGRQLWFPEWNRIIDVPDTADVTSYPGIYGICFADPDFDFTPVEWKRAWRVQQASRWAGWGAAAAALILGVSAGFLQAANGPLRDT
ncbi:MAG TPA: hypothetical protein EYP57_09540, partial [Thermodesulfobacteriaceae bacterium]|nr:hypothetical protein [Thermodesulfobacteriaceae bacterium]